MKHPISRSILLLAGGIIILLSASSGLPGCAAWGIPPPLGEYSIPSTPEVFLPLISGPPSCTLWVAPPPKGNDAHPGTQDRPWATLEQAAKQAPASGGVVCFLPGVYPGGARINRQFTGPIVFMSFPPYQAVLHNNGAVISISGGRNITIEGFDIHHTGPGATPLVVAIDGSHNGWAENIVLRNNIIHDSYDDDLLKIYSGASQITIENNIFYNQGDGEEHMDVNSVTDVFIQDNIFFNSYESSGRVNLNQAKQYIVIKDSDGDADGLLGSQRVTVRRNIFLNWQGQDDETFIQVGLDGKPYFEAIGVRIENNLLIGNSPLAVGEAFGVRGAKDVAFVNNTIVGDLPSSAYAFWASITDQNPRNENITLSNNIWSDPTGSMGARTSNDSSRFSKGNPAQTINLVLDNNLYWNGGRLIPSGDLLSPLQDDPRRLVADPLLPPVDPQVTLPLWNGGSFPTGSITIRAEFERLAQRYAALTRLSPAIDASDPTLAPKDDILSRPRTGDPDIGAYEYLQP